MVAKADRHRLRDVAYSRAINPVPQASDHRVRISAQAGSNTRASRLHRDDMADMREAMGLRCRRFGFRRERRPGGSPAYRQGHTAAFARANDRASRSAIGMANADTIITPGRKSARSVSKAVRAG